MAAAVGMVKNRPTGMHPAREKTEITLQKRIRAQMCGVVPNSSRKIAKSTTEQNTLVLLLYAFHLHEIVQIILPEAVAQ